MHEVVIPRLGNTVESVIIVEWRKEVGERVNIGEALCEVETDKSTVEVEAEKEGILLARLFEAGDEVPVLGRFAILGEEGDVFDVRDANADEPIDARGKDNASQLPETGHGVDRGDISPRARKLAQSAGINPRLLTVSAAEGISGTGPGGRIIERDVKNALAGVTGAGADSNGYGAPKAGAQTHPNIPTRNILSPSPASSREVASHTEDFPGPIEVIPIAGVRKVIASRMHASLSKTAQITLNTSAPAGSILTWRQSLKDAPIGREGVSINHLLMFSVARLLPHHPGLNATFHGREIRRYANVHLGFAVDAPRGLMTPVIRYANKRNLSSLTAEARRLADACRGGYISPDELAGSTFTVTNLGALGIESFTPVLNAPEVAILGVGAVSSAPIETETETGIGIEKRIGLSLTIDHQAVDGAPGARFLAHLVRVLAQLELTAVL